MLSAIGVALRAKLVAAGVPNVVVGRIRENAPERVVSVTMFPVMDEQATNVSIVGAKVLIRRPQSDGSNASYDDQDAVYDVITSLHFTDLGGHTISGASRDRSAPPFTDSTGRDLIADTYYLTTHR